MRGADSLGRPGDSLRTRGWPTFPARDLILLFIFAMIFGTLILQGLTSRRW
jgi:NhaP-type Na+/H+ or K+/H+ antiporter